MSAVFALDRSRNALSDMAGRRFDAGRRRWSAGRKRRAIGTRLETLDAIGALTWLQRESGYPLRQPIGVIGPREATRAQLATALEVGELLGGCGVTVLCGGRQGVMQAVCEGVARVGGLSIGLLPEPHPTEANPFVSVAIATGIGEARNALIARASFCLIAIGNSLGTLSEVALGRQFGKLVVGLQNAADVDGVRHVGKASDAVATVAEAVLAIAP